MGKKSSLKAGNVKSALKTIGLEFTRPERRQMIAALDEQIVAAKALRQVRFPNDLTPAQRFDPRLPGFEMPKVKDGVTLPKGKAKLPHAEADIAFAPLPHLAQWIASGQITSRRLTEIYLDRIARFAPDLFCFATVMAEAALAEAEARDAETAKGRNRGPLHGLPYGLKDLFDTKGVRTGWGAEPYAGRVPEGDASIVTRLREAGAVLIGKTSVGALAYGDKWYGGVSRNPWNPAEGSSGSSAGSASAVAAGLCAFAIGTETLGSIVSPSERCGATGLRPTFGRISRAGGMALCWSLDKVGPIARGVADCALVAEALVGADPADRDSLSAPFGANLARAPKGLRVGYLKGAIETARPGLKSAEEAAQPGIGAALSAFAEMGLVPKEVTLPDLPYESLNNVVLAEAAAAFEELTLSDRDDELGWQDDAAWPNLFRAAHLLSAVDHVQLDRLRTRVMQALDALFSEIDVLVGPPFAGPMLIASNFTGHPCLHLRAGFTDEKTRAGGTLSVGGNKAPGAAKGKFRVPHGVSLWASLYREDRLLEVGQALEKALGVAAERPKGL
jgi:Asp-tRNA(Asn)/Glu-tRNA(Gln) amidotransferase A subunit family amidase